MAGMTDTAFRRLVKRHGGCGLVVTEMVSSEGLVRGIDRTLEYAEYTEEERPVSIQIFGGDPDKMAAAAQIVEGMGADIVDVNMGCPVPKIAKHNAGCSLMREPAHAATRDRRDGKGRQDSGDREDARRVERRDAQRPRARQDGAGRRGCRGRRPRPHRGTVATAASADWDLVSRSRRGPDDPGARQRRLHRARAGRRADDARACSGVLVGRGVLRNPWILAQAADWRPAGRLARSRCSERGRFLLDYIELLLNERVERGRGFRHVAPGSRSPATAPARGRERWVINKSRARSGSGIRRGSTADPISERA